MMRLRRASVIGALSLLAWAATASAECAWVLWQSVINTVPGGSQEWGIMQAVRGQEACDAIRIQHLANFKPSDEWSRVRDTLVYKPVAAVSGSFWIGSVSQTPWTRAGRRGSDDYGFRMTRGSDR